MIEPDFYYKLCNYSKRYYIIIDPNIYSFEKARPLDNNTISELLQITKKQYTDIMMNGFNGIDYTPQFILFPDEQSVINAINFIKMSKKMQEL